MTKQYNEAVFRLDPRDVAVAVETALGRRCPRVEIVHASKSRPVFRCHMEGGDGPSAVIAKGHGRGDGLRIHEAGRLLWQRGFAADPVLRLPRPIAFLPDLGVALQEEAPGRSLHELIDSPAETAATLPRIARWLRKLHAVPVLADDAFGRSVDHDKVRRNAKALATAIPRHASRIRRLAVEAAEVMLSAGGAAQAITHGDFQPKNIYVTPDVVSVIDFDRVSLASPSRDVAHFLAQCMTMSFSRAGSFEEITAWTAPFLDTYRDGADPASLRDLPAYFVHSMIEILYYRLVVRPVRDPSFVPAWIVEAERWWKEAA